jgi:diguanylate cyclase (GGDEF)-like protein/PAS domain S-box-containing protein
MGESRLSDRPDIDIVQLLDALPDGVRIVNQDFMVLWINDALARMAGMDQAATLGRKCYETFSGERCHTVGCPLTRILQGENPVADQYDKVCSDGAVIPCLVVAKPYRGADGKVIGIIEDFRDITEIRQFEEDLLRSENYYRAIFQTTGAAMAISEEDTTLVLVNPEFAALAGYAAVELEGKKSWTEFFVADDLERMMRYHHLRRVDPDAAPREYEARFIDRYGRLKDVYLTAAMIPGTRKSVVSLIDITARRQSEAALQESEKRYRLLAENVRDVIWTMDLNRRFTYLSPSVMELLGYSVEEGQAKTLEEVLTPSSLAVCLRTLEEKLAQAALQPPGPAVSFTLELEAIAKDRAIVWTNSKMSLLRDPEGKPAGIIGVTRDIQERKLVQEELQASEARFRAVFEKGAMGMAMVDRDGRLLETNVAFQEMLGYRGEELRGKAFTEITHPEDAPKDLMLFQELMAGKRDSYEMEKRYLSQDGRLLWGHLVVSPIRDTAGEPRLAVGIIKDLTARKQAETLSHDLFFTSPIGVYLIQDRKFVMVNQSFQDITGYDRDELLGKESLWMVETQDRAMVKQEAVRMVKGERSLPLEFKIITKSGAGKWVMESLTSTHYQGRRAALGYFMDITPRRQAEEKQQEWVRKYRNQVEMLKKSEARLKDLSIRDGLTGLLNHKEFHRRLRDELERSRRYGHPFSLLMLDLDHFKDINDAYGHLAGDEALFSVAALIQEEARVVDVVARYGGEEFAVILPETSAMGALDLAERIRRIVAGQKITCASGLAVSVTISIGVAVFPDDASSEEKLIAQADAALYTAKRTGRNRVVTAAESDM